MKLKNAKQSQKKRLLVAWMGHNDLRGLAGAASTTAQQKKLIAELVPGELPKKPEPGPIRTLVDGMAFDEVHLLSTFNKQMGSLYAKWIGKHAKVLQVDLPNPTDYEAIFEIADKVLAEVTGENVELNIHLSPGSPAMAAIWVLLGKSRYPATFYQSHQGQFWQTEIPFDLLVDFVPDVMKDADSQWQHLVSHAPQEVRGFESIVGDSNALRLAVGRAQKAAIRDVPVLVLGESGTGKELFASALHKASPRRDKPFLALNCAALPKDLLESELFGHKKGAFTGASTDHVGAFEKADGGTLFLDEVGECDLSIQAKLLRVLQPPAGKGPCCRVFRRVGDNQEREVDVRVVAATNRNLVEAIQAGTFREDLYYRLAVITIALPPLRDRGADVILLAEGLLSGINREFAINEPGFSDKKLSVSAKKFIREQSWPGNVRQLQNCLIQAAVMSDGVSIKAGDLSAALGDVQSSGVLDLMNQPLGGDFDLEMFLQNIRKHYLERAMHESGGVKKEAAAMLGIANYQTLSNQLQKLNVKVEESR